MPQSSDRQQRRLDEEEGRGGVAKGRRGERREGKGGKLEQGCRLAKAGST